MKSLTRQIADLEQLCEHRGERIEYLENRLAELELHTIWADGEIDFWQAECYKAENSLKTKGKPWWRYVIS